MAALHECNKEAKMLNMKGSKPNAFLTSHQIHWSQQSLTRYTFLQVSWPQTPLCDDSGHGKAETSGWQEGRTAVRDHEDRATQYQALLQSSGLCQHTRALTVPSNEGRAMRDLRAQALRAIAAMQEISSGAGRGIRRLIWAARLGLMVQEQS